MKKDADDLRSQLEVLAAKERKRGIKFSNVEVVESETKQIMLPEGMTAKEATKWLERFEAQQNQEVGIHIEVDAFPLDGALALARTLKELFGWTNLESVPGGFFSPDRPPVQVAVETGPDTAISVPWGRMTIPGVDGFIETRLGTKGLRPIFIISGVTTRRNEKLIHQIGDQVKLRVLSDSIYRGKAIVLNFRDADGNRIEPEEVDPTDCPKFINTSKVNSEELVFPEETMQQIETCLFNPIRHSEACRKHGIPLKRGVLLEGPYGTGKTQTAHLLAKECVENGWTYLYIKDVRDLDIAVSIAESYQPCAIFGEDVNRIVGEKRDAEVDRILNTMDGVQSKKTEIMVVLTTNELSSIHQAAVRPGRIDTVVAVRAPDSPAACRLVRLYSRGSVEATDAELELALRPLVHRQATAAMFREVIERAKLSAIGKLDNPEDDIKIDSDDIQTAVHTLMEHQKLLMPKTEPNTNPMNLFGSALGRAIGSTLSDTLSDIAGEFSSRLEDSGTPLHAVSRHLGVSEG